MTIHIRDDTAAAVTAGASVDFDMAVIAGSIKGGTATVGARVFVTIRVAQACELRVFTATNGPSGALVFRDRGTVEKLVANADFRGIFTALGTNMRFRVTVISATDSTVEFFSTIL